MINPDQHHRKSSGGEAVVVTLGRSYSSWRFLAALQGPDMHQVDGDLWELYSSAPVAWHSGLVDAQKKPRRRGRG